jgi:hypothetical protein
MIPNGMLWQPLEVFFAKDLPVSGELCQYPQDWLGWDGLWVQQYPSNEIGGGPLHSGCIPLPWDKSGPLCIFHMQDDGQLGMIYPSFLPVDIGLYGCEPGVPQYRLLLPQIREIEAESGVSPSGLD